MLLIVFFILGICSLFFFALFHKKEVKSDGFLISYAGKKVNTTVLQVILALLIAGTAIKIWMDIF